MYEVITMNTKGNQINNLFIYGGNSKSINLANSAILKLLQVTSFFSNFV